MTLPFDMSFGAAAFMVLAFGVAAFVRGYAGFGFSALVVTASSLVTNPLYFVAVVMFCEFLMTFQQWRGVWRDVDWPRVTALMIGALVGVPLGLWAITQVPVDTARAVIAAYVLVMCGVLMLGWRLQRKMGFAADTGVGTFAGLANAVGMAGLPVGMRNWRVAPTCARRFADPVSGLKWATHTAAALCPSRLNFGTRVQKWSGMARQSPFLCQAHFAVAAIRWNTSGRTP